MNRQLLFLSRRLKPCSPAGRSSLNSSPRHFAGEPTACNPSSQVSNKVSWGAALAILSSVAGGAYFYSTLVQSQSKPVNEDQDNGLVHTTIQFGWPATLRSTVLEGVEWAYDVGPFNSGKPVSFQYKLKDETEVEEMFTKNQKSTVIKRKGNPVVRWDENFVMSTSGEDRHAVDIVTQEETLQLAQAGQLGAQSFWEKWTGIKQGHKEELNHRQDNVSAGTNIGRQDLVLFSVFDGFEGSTISELMKRGAHACMAHGFGVATSQANGFQNDMLVRPGNLVGIIQDVYHKLDNDLVHTPLKVLSTIHSKQDHFSLLPPGGVTCLINGMLPVSGCTATTAMVDAENGALYVANSGDSRAVAGWYNTRTNTWRCDQLSVDHTPENPSEALRVTKEHPEEDPADVILDQGYRKRTLGRFSHTRNMGNAYTKVEQSDSQGAIARYQGDKLTTTLGKPLTHPPYISGEPEMTVRSIAANKEEELRFLILATDGLWDRMTSEEAVMLTASFLQQVPDIVQLPKAATQMVQLENTSQPRPYPAQPFPGTPGRDKGNWVFKDKNAATHLIRNSIGDGDEMIRRQMMSAEGKGSRDACDDVTAIVVFFDKTD